MDFYDGDILLGMATTSLQALLNNSVERALTVDVMADVGGVATAKLTASEIKLEKSVGISEVCVNSDFSSPLLFIAVSSTYST